MEVVEHQTSRNGYQNNSYYELGTVQPSQYYDIVGHRRALEGERKLMLAVLQDAIQCYLRNGHPKTLHQQAVLLETKAWFNADTNGGDGGPFGFRNVCYALGIEPTSLRRRVRELAERGTPVRRLRRLPHAVSTDVRISAGGARSGH